MLLEQQNKKRLLMARKDQEDQETMLRTINSLPDQLKIAHTSVKELLENLPAYFQNIEDFKRSIPADTKALQRCEEALDKKEAEIKAFENKYNEVIQMTPEALKEEQRQIKDRAILLMQKDLGKLKLERDNTTREVEEKNERTAGLDGALERARVLVPEPIEDPIKLAPKLCDV
jgi:DNA repair ATPase RecN